jgi:Domain of unknown function (DUF4266)
MRLSKRFAYGKVRSLIASLTWAALSSVLVAFALAGCAAVKPFEREKLSDPIMDPSTHFNKQTLEQKFFSTREGSIACGSGIGGGCGCAK